MHASDSYSLQLPIDRTILLRRPCFFVVKTSQIQVLEVLKVFEVFALRRCDYYLLGMYQVQEVEYMEASLERQLRWY